LEFFPKFRKTNAGLIHLEINGILLNKPPDIAEAFSKLFQSVCSSYFPGTFPSINQFKEVLSLAPISNPDVHITIKRL
jgi:hypothetical protein